MPKRLAESFDKVRMQAFNILQRLERSRDFAGEMLDRSFSLDPGLRPVDRAFITELVLGVLRWRGRLDWVLLQALHSPRRKLDPRVQDILRLGVYQLLFLDRVPASAAINESVRMVKSIIGDEKASGFVNAVLRAIVSKKDTFAVLSPEKEPVEYLSSFLSHPPWLAERWLKEYGFEIAAAICKANNRRPPWTLRVNTLKISREILMEELRKIGISSRPTLFSPVGLIAEKNPLHEGKALFQEGLFFLQDEGSQIIPYLLQPQPGERILDVCSAPGGKSTHIAQLMADRGEIVALDRQKKKIQLVRENALRLGVSILTTLPADAVRPLPIQGRVGFDRILVDAPCTNLGILHRNPEARWRRKPEDPQRLQRLQSALLQNAVSYLKPGGVLVYSTCTLTAEENDQVVNGFLLGNPDFCREDLHSILDPSWDFLLDPEGFYRTYPRMLIQDEEYRMDGFFAARMKRKKL